MKKLFVGMMFMLAPLCAAFAQDVVGKWKLEDILADITRVEAE